MPRRTTRVLALTLLASGCSVTPPPPTDVSVDTPIDVPTDEVSVPTDHPYVDPFVCTPSTTALPLDAVLDTTHARAGTITRTEELVTGEASYGQVGHYKLYNNRVQFVIENASTPAGPSRPVGYNLYGGSLIDADRVRAQGAPGQDLFRELFPVLGYRVSSTDEVSVVCDGSNGSPAAIRIVGHDVSTRLLAQIDGLARPRSMRIITHYVLRPDSDVMEIRTQLDSQIGQPLYSIAVADFLAFGSGTTVMTTLTGFGNPSESPDRLPMVLSVSDPGENNRHVSYGVAPSQGLMNVLFADESGLGALRDPIAAPADGFGETVEYFAVGTGDAASVALPLYRARGDAYGTVGGRTAPNALVYAYKSPYAMGGATRMFARADATGMYAMPLAPGSYDLMAVDQGTRRGTPVSVTVTQNVALTTDVQPGASGTLVLDLAVTGMGGVRQRVPMKIAMQGLDVEPPDSMLGNLEGERENQGLHRAIYSRTGIEQIKIKPGRYRMIVSHGDEHDSITTEVVVPPDGQATLTADLTRVVDTTGYITADFHQHTVGSVDSPRALCNRVLENVAEGLEYASTTDHDNVTDFAPCIAQLGLGMQFNAIRGNEISVVGTGHFNAYPLAPNPADPYKLIGAQYWADLSMQELADKIHAEPTDPVLHISHPRSGSLKGYFTGIGLDPTTLASRRPIARGFEAIEVNESVGSPEQFIATSDADISARAVSNATSIPVLWDFSALISRGSHICALGNSDTHTRNGKSGWPHNLVRVGTDQPSMVTVDMVRTAIRQQKVIVANGIVVKTKVNGQERMGYTEVVPMTNGLVDLEVDIQAPPWVTVRNFTVYENGRPLALTADTQGGYTVALATSGAQATNAVTATTVVRWNGHLKLRPTRDAWYMVVATGGPMDPAGHGNAFGYTNPVYVDANGAGWTPPSM